jgi:oligopeptide/dipeptide ABC transporter ATP-binding protein
MSALVEAAGVSLRIGEMQVLSDITLAVARGETFAVIGESGCGKSTLGRTLLMLQRPSEGRVIFGGQDITDFSRGKLRKQRRRMQMIFQDPYASLNPRMTIGETLAEPLVVHGLASWRGAREKVAAALELVGLDPAFARRTPHAFSGGQRQRIAIARAVIAGPELVVADEPLSALDITVQGQIIELFEKLRAAMGLTYVFISHDLPVVRHFAARVAVMLRGRIVEIGDPAVMFASPAHPYTRALLEAVPVPDPEYERHKMRMAARPKAPAPRAGQGGACPYVGRCRHAFSLCSEIMPPLREVSAGWHSACWLLETSV